MKRKEKKGEICQGKAMKKSEEGEKKLEKYETKKMNQKKKGPRRRCDLIRRFLISLFCSLSLTLPHIF